MNNSHGLSSSRLCFALLLFGALPLLACDQSNSVGKIGDAAAVGGSGDADVGSVTAGGTTASGAAGSAAGGTTASAGAVGGAGQGGGTTTGQAGAKGGGQAGALGGGSAVDAGVGAAGGTSAKGGAGGTRGDAAIDGHVCPPLTNVYCSRYTTDAYGCQVCAFSGTGGGAGGVTSTGGTGGTGGGGGSSGVAGSSGSGKACQRNDTDDKICRSRNYPPLAYFCEVPAQPTSKACVIYNGIGSGDFYCCPEPYPVCPDSPPTLGGACTGSLVCSYGSHPDKTCRTRATCTRNGTWDVSTPPARCSEAQLPATCPASPATGSCSSHGLNCAYADGTYCSCTNCTVEDNLCQISAPDTWRCWSPPSGECPVYYPNLGTTCSLPANTQCRYTCDAITLCNAEGVWVDFGNRCPN